MVVALLVEQYIHDSMFEDLYLAVAGTGDLYYKTLWIHNLRKMDRYRFKQVSFLMSVNFAGLDKHTSLQWNQYIMNGNLFIVQAPVAAVTGFETSSLES